MQEIGVRGPASTAGFLHHVHVVHHHQLSSAHATVHNAKSQNAVQKSQSETTTSQQGDGDRNSSGEEEGSSPCHSPIDLR